MPEASGHPGYECEECGYDLTSLVRVAPVTCPECGRQYAWPHEWPPPVRRRPWPPWWRIGLRMCHPATAVVAVSCLTATFLVPVHWLAVSVLWVAWLCAVIACPVIEARVAARDHVLRPDRGRTEVVLALAGIGANLLLTFLLVVIGVLVWG